MEPLLLKELELIAMITSNEETICQFKEDTELGYYSFSSKQYSFLQHPEAQKIWRNFVDTAREKSDVKSSILSSIEEADISQLLKEKLKDLVLQIWFSKFNPTQLELIYSAFKRKAELRIAQDLIHSFQEKMNHFQFSLKDACDDFFMDAPIFVKTKTINQLLGENSQIYWNSEKTFSSFLELEQELRIHKEFHNIRWVLNCTIQKQSTLSEDKFKELMHNLGLELLFITKKE
jgi:hypothetical protein